jgi:type VI secretion system protein ImpL
MKAGIDAVLSYVLYTAASILGILLALGFVLVFDWPWWVGLFLVLLFTGLALGGLFLRKIWLRRREQGFAKGFCELDLAQAKAQSQQQHDELNCLQQQWKSAIATLRRSQLGKSGNPLYALPWYLVIGASGSGKSSALSSARLSSPLEDGNREAGLPEARQCDWCFSERAVIIDTAGRYALHVNAEQDRDEWHKLLSLLLKYRRREPLNGLIVTVAADRLLKGGESLEKEGSALRQRIDELMRGAGVRVPVYLLVTKCDLIPGLQSFCRFLPPQSLHQPMGVINHELSLDAGTFTEGALRAIDERLRDLRLQLMHLPQAQQGATSELLRFPEEFRGLKHGLASFTSHAFGTNPYQETPLLRGVFFGSARQEGQPHNPTNPVTGQGTPAEPPLPDTGTGLFLHDFFATVLPRDRSLPVPTGKARQWRSLTGNLGLASWAVLGVALCGLLSFSFAMNLKAIRGISRGFATTTPLRHDLPAEMASLERFRQEILKVEQHNRNWWIPRFGLSESLQVEKGLKGRFCRQFQELVLTPADRQMAAGVATITRASSDDLHGQYLVHLVRRINILKTSLHVKSLPTLLAKPQPAYLAAMPPAASAGSPEARQAFGTLYLHFLHWRTEPGAVRQEIAELQGFLKQLTVVKGDNLQALATWVDRQSGIPAVKLRDFWGGSLTLNGEKSVAPVFTLKGKETLDGLVRELTAAVPDPAQLAPRKTALASWHRGAAAASWRDFAADFSRGEASLRGLTEWQQAASRMSTEQGPYFALMNRLVLELEPLWEEASLPPWLQQIGQFQSARAQGFVPDHAAITRAAEGGKKILTSIRKNVGEQAGAQKLEAQMATAKACLEYCGALQAITPGVASRNQSFQLASQTFGEDPATGKSPLYLASFAASRLRDGISGSTPDPVFGQLLQGPLEFLWSYLRKESASQLQALWEEQVLAATLGMAEQQAIPALLGPEGLAWRFVKGPAAPFLTRDLSGYHAKQTLGGAVAFEASLFNFLKKGAQAQASVLALGKPQHFSVGIKGLPTDANAEARVKPQATRLEIQCGGTSQSLVNNNYPVARTFSWTPDACGDALLQIEVADVVLTRHYPGQQGFPDLLKDLQGGRRTFTVKEFPGERQALERLGVKTITVNYQFIGSGAILKQTATLAGQAPRNIARCWPR